MKRFTRTIFSRVGQRWRWRLISREDFRQFDQGIAADKTAAIAAASQRRNELFGPNQQMKTIVAIDPGAQGGIAWEILGTTTGPVAYAMPETEGDIIETLKSIRDGADGPPVAFVEQVGGFIRGSPAPGSAMFNFGRNFGFLLGCMQSFGYRIELIRPQQWQKEFSLGTKGDCASRTEWKNKLKARAQQLYPETKVTLGTADALLILEYAKKHNG